MRIMIVGALAMLTAFSGQAMAACEAGTREGNVRNLLSGNTLCGRRGNETWQEEHRGSGNPNSASELWDYKKGPGDPSDPQERVGTWEASNGANGTVTYNYKGGQTYTYTVHDNGGGTYGFCDGGNEIVTARLQNGTNAQCNPLP